jgi:arylsulfatase A-like enzyme
MGRSLLRKGEVTMADVFKAGGYRTGIFGKWHLGDNYPFRPQDRGFDEALIHKGGGIGNTQDYWGNDYFDDTYFRNGEPEKFEGYCTDVWFAEAMKFIEANRDRPFFCYLPTNAPHGPYRVPEKYSRPYKGKGVKFNFYGMIANIDENMGRLMNKLKRLGIEDNTILIFMTDNGTSGGYLVYNAGMRGSKNSEYDGLQCRHARKQELGI